MAEIEVNAGFAAVVSQLVVAPGQAVSEGEELLVMEAMKMEIPVESPSSGAVLSIHVAEGDVVEEGQLLLRLAAT